MSRSRKPAKPEPPRPTLQMDNSGLLVSSETPVNALAVVEDRVNFYAGLIDALTAQLCAPRKVIPADVEAHGEATRRMQENCRSARVVLTELKLVRDALRSGMLVAPGANPSRL